MHANKGTQIKAKNTYSEFQAGGEWAIFLITIT